MRLMIVFCAVTAYVGAETRGQIDIRLEELAEQARITEGKVHSISVTINSSNITRRLTSDGPTEANGNHRETWFVDIRGIGWAEGQGTVSQLNPDGTKTVGVEEFWATFDGEVGKRFMRLDVEGVESAAFASIEKRLQGRLGSPMSFIEKARSFIEKGNCKIAEAQIWDGREVIVVQKHFDSGKSTRSMEYWIDPELQFTVVRRIQRKLDEQSGKWSVESTRDFHDHRRLADRVWLPQKATFKSYSSPGFANNETEFLFTDWRIDEKLDREKLNREFPEGVSVRNSK
ncbi:hypothetical protein SH467x_002142 [Pirellulaceae bacterium SH467]